MQQDQKVFSIHHRRCARSFLWLGTSALAILATPALSQTVDVTNTSDTGPGSLRAAIAAANSSPTIKSVRGVVPLDSTITLSSGPVDINSTFTLDAENAFKITNIPDLPNRAAMQLSGGNTLTIAAPVTVSTQFFEAPAPIPVVGGIRILDTGNRLDIYGKVTTSGGRQLAIVNEGKNNEIRVRDGASVSSTGSYTGSIGSTGAGAKIILEAGSELTARSFYGRGIVLSGEGTVVDIDGRLSTTGSASHGIFVEAGAENSAINVSGRVATEYEGLATGVLVQADNVVVAVSENGEVTTQDHALSKAISFGASANQGTAIVAGLVSAGAAGQAIEFKGADNRLELQSGYSITGAVSGAGSDLLVFGGASSASFDLASLGAQYTGFDSLQKIGTSIWTLTGDGSAFSGPISILEGKLDINGALDSALTVQSGGVLGGTGTLGAVTLADGGILEPGSSPGTLHMNSLFLNDGSVLNFELGAPEIAAASDRVEVAGDLTLDGILNVTDAGGFGSGVYTLFDYGNLVADNRLVVGTAPKGYTLAVDTGTGAASAVTLAVSGGMAGSSQYWDGANTAPGGTLYGRGGAGVWNAATTNWTDTAGTTNGVWGGQFGVFYNGTGDVTVEGPQNATGLQFAADGYRLVAGAGGALDLIGTDSTLRVDAGATATLALPLSVAGDLGKQGAGTLNLAGDSTIAATMRVSDGVLRVTDGAEVGANAALAGTGGQLEVVGSGSTLSLTNTQESALGIGLSGVGNLSVMDGGNVVVDAELPTQIGRNAGGTGDVLISGAGSDLRILDGGLDLGFAGGVGEITVTDGGHLQVDGGYLVTLVPGGGPLGEDLTRIAPENELIIGKDIGTATLNVTNGGTVEAGLMVINTQSQGSSLAASTAKVLIDGHGSSISVNENMQMFKGGTILVSGGAQLNTFVDSTFAADPNRHIIAADRIYGEKGNPASVRVTGLGSSWHSGNTIHAEEAATFIVDDGGLFSAENGIRIGFGRSPFADLPASLLVDNATLKTGTFLEVANGGAQAEARFINGAIVETNGVQVGGGATISGGVSYSAEADILVSGAGTKWTDTGGLTAFNLGDSGVTTMTVTDGAVVETENRTIFGWGSYLDGRADVVVSDGARFSTSKSLELGFSANGTGTLTVEGAGSLVGIGDSFEIGLSGKGAVVVRDGGEIEVAGDTFIGTSAGGEGRLTVRDGGQVVTDRIYMGITDGSASGAMTIGEGSAHALVNASRFDLRSGALRLGENGILDLGGGIASISPRGLVTGTGTINADLVLDGLIAPGHGGVGTLRVDGDATFNVGSIYSVDLQAPDISDRIAITGTATIDGGKIGIAKLSTEDSYVDGQTYTIVTANKVDVIEDFALNQPFSLLRADVLHQADRIDLTLTADVPFTSLAGTFNQFQTALGLQDLAQTGDALAAYNTLVGLSLQPGGDAAVRQAFDQTSGEVHAAGQHMIDQSFAFFNRTLRYRGTSGLGSGNAGASAPNDATNYTDASARGAWAAPLGSFGHIDGDGNAAQLDRWSAGLAGGYEGVIDVASGHAVGGFGFGYIHSRGTIDDRLSTFDSDGFYLGAYGAWTDGRWNLAGSLAYGANRVSTERNIAFMGVTAEADYRARTIGLSGEASYSFDLDASTKLAPLFTLDTGWSRHGGFTETGAGALNLTSGSESWNYLDAGLGIALTRTILTENGNMTLEGRAVWEHAFADVVPSQPLALAGSPTGFTVLGPDAGRDRLRIGTGISWKTSEGMTIRAQYDGLFSGNQTNHSASLGLNIRF